MKQEELAKDQPSMNEDMLYVPLKDLEQLKRSTIEKIREIDGDLGFIKRSAPQHADDAVLLFYFSGRRVEFLKQKEYLTRLVASLEKLMNTPQ